jgi:serine/threonine protein kinase
MEDIARQIYDNFIGDTTISSDISPSDMSDLYDACRYLSHTLVEESVPCCRTFPWRCMVRVINSGIDIRGGVVATKRVDTPLGYREAYMMKCLSAVDEVIGMMGCCSLYDGCIIMMEVGRMDLLTHLQPNTSIQIPHRWIMDILRGIRGMHRLDIVHGDIKPENLLLMEDGGIKICDLGSCFIVGMKTRSIVGTLPYMAPEMKESLLDRISETESSVMLDGYEHSHMYGKEIDIWSVSCVILGLKTRHLPPFQNREDMIRKVTLLNGGCIYPGLVLDPEKRPPIDVLVEYYDRLPGFVPGGPSKS